MPKPETAERPFRTADLLLLLPFIWQLALAPWANQISWRPLSLPFGMAWQMAGIVFATIILALRYWIDVRPRAGDLDAPQEPGQ
jgi:hypothetical protein